MQADFNPELSEERLKELREDLGFFENPVPFEAEKIEAALEHPEVEQVRVFRLEKGMRVNIGHTIYKVALVRPDGKVVLKPIGNSE